MTDKLPQWATDRDPAAIAAEMKNLDQWVVDTFMRWAVAGRVVAADSGVIDHCRDLGLLDRALCLTPLGRAVAVLIQGSKAEGAPDGS